MALLAAYLREQGGYQSLTEYLEKKVFSGSSFETITADPSDVEGFRAFMTRYKQGLAVEGRAVEQLR